MRRGRLTRAHGAGLGRGAFLRCVDLTRSVACGRSGTASCIRCISACGRRARCCRSVLRVCVSPAYSGSSRRAGLRGARRDFSNGILRRSALIHIRTRAARRRSCAVGGSVLRRAAEGAVIIVIHNILILYFEMRESSGIAAACYFIAKTAIMYITASTMNDGENTEDARDMREFVLAPGA